MKTPQLYLAAVSCLVGMILAPSAHAQGITVERLNLFAQSGATTVTADPTPFSFRSNVRGGNIDISAWGPKFYKAGSAGVPATGASSDTNTGTLNFSATPNNGTDYLFIHEFGSDAAMLSVYPVAPTESGNYGIKFLGTTPPSPSTFTTGLQFAGGNYPTTTPQITTVNNSAAWSAGVLHLKTSGTTTLNFNTFSEYTTSTYGSLIGVGIYDSHGTVIDSVSRNTYYIPSLGYTDPAVTSITLNGSLLTVGETYTLELQYGILASPLGETSLNGTNFQGLSAYYKNTAITIVAETGTGVAGVAADFNADGKTDLVWENPSTGDRAFWLMNGTTPTSMPYLANIPGDWHIATTGDFDNDGNSDLVWENNVTGDRAFWLMNGTAIASAPYLAGIPTDWHIVASGDFNSDGKRDLVWQNLVTGDRTVWLMNGTALTTGVYLANIPSAWEIAGAGDFNADGKPDLVWQNFSTGERTIWLMNGTTLVSGVYLGIVAPEWKIVGTGDFNGDNKTDLLWENTSTGERKVWLMNGTDFSSEVSVTTVDPAWKLVR